MLKFIKMKQQEGYLLYYSVLFVFIVVLTLIKKCSANSTIILCRAISARALRHLNLTSS